MNNFEVLRRNQGCREKYSKGKVSYSKGIISSYTYQNRIINARLNHNRIIKNQNRIINNQNRIINNQNRIIHNQNRNINFTLHNRIYVRF